jgi:hypothetical protein
MTSYWDKPKASRPIDVPTQKSFYAKPVVHHQVVNSQPLKSIPLLHKSLPVLNDEVKHDNYDELSAKYQQLVKAYKKLKKQNDLKVVNKPKDLKVVYDGDED